jgi:hypothetical protein
VVEQAATSAGGAGGHLGGPNGGGAGGHLDGLSPGSGHGPGRQLEDRPVQLVAPLGAAGFRSWEGRQPAGQKLGGWGWIFDSPRAWLGGVLPAAALIPHGRGIGGDRDGVMVVDLTETAPPRLEPPSHLTACSTFPSTGDDTAPPRSALSLRATSPRAPPPRLKPGASSRPASSTRSTL